MKLVMLAGAAALAAGMAQAQPLSCTAATANTSGLIRAESNDDQVGDVTVSCTGGAAGSAAATVALQVTMVPGVTITSATLGSGNAAKSETLAGPTANFATAVNGSVSGNTVTFSNIAVGALLANQTTTLTITNIKIQASSIAGASGTYTAVNEQIFVSGTNVNSNVLTANNVAFVTNGLTGVKASGPNNAVSNNAICNQITGANMNFTVAFAENFANAFKIQGSTNANTTLGSWFTNNSETGYAVTAPASNQATSGTRIAITFANVPSNVNVYVPLTLTDSVGGTGTMKLVTSATGAQVLATAAATSGNNPPPGQNGQVSISNGTGTAVY
ncbi:MAG TPA: hypothetical protein VHC90_21100 [Bryobacteraceae bacterium]|nr:hypothetical protein [Bryobacteraceae bacterium]